MGRVRKPDIDKRTYARRALGFEIGRSVAELQQISDRQGEREQNLVSKFGLLSDVQLATDVRHRARCT